MKKKINKTEKQPNKNILNKAKHKTILIKKVKQNTQEMQKKKKQEDREESNTITWSPFPSTPWRNLSFD